MHQKSLEEILDILRSQANPENVAGMARFGINPDNTLGVSIPKLRELARQQGKNHSLALELWQTGIHEARLLASMIADKQLVDEAQMEAWVQDLDSWDICDQVCSNLFDRTPFAYDKAREWSARSEEFVKRAGFVLMAGLAVHDKKAANTAFEPFFPILVREACDERNFVKKAVNWALRGLGKRNRSLNQAAIRTALEIQQLNCKAARWIASDALRELTGEKVQNRLSR